MTQIQKKIAIMEFNLQLVPFKQRHIIIMLSQNGLYGMISGVITTALLQPFENIKMAIMIPPATLNLNKNFASNIATASRFIYEQDGWRGFYKGLVAAIFKAALGCYSFFGTLKYLQRQQQHAGHNFLHSFFARIVSTIVTNPLNIIETRFQLADFHGYNSVHGAIIDIYHKEGFRGYFSGCLTSCYKEGFFAGFYYMLYEELKKYQISKFAAGIGSGMLATAITHPFELIRARLQTMGLKQKVQFERHMILKELIQLKRSGDWMRGLAPRLIKKPMANTLTFIIFELIDEAQGFRKE